MIKKIDLNCDLGEGYDDAAIMPYISSCNIACGGHYGNTITIEKAIALAKINGVAIGAHPSYPDKENFGRKSMAIPISNLIPILADQISKVDSLCKAVGTNLHHIKPHGALYNDMAKDRALALAILKFCKKMYPDIIIYGMANSVVIDICKNLNLTVWPEVFADRNYDNHNTLSPRANQAAITQDPQNTKNKIDQFLNYKLIDIQAKQHYVQPKTICLHSDTDFAVQLAVTIHTHLIENDIQITTDS